MRILDRVKQKFYDRGISSRIVLILSALMIATGVGVALILFGVYQSNLTRELRLSTDKDMDMAMEKMDMFFDEVENDTVSVLVSENAQTLLSGSSSALADDILERHRRYRILRSLVDGYITQKGMYRTIAFYDESGTCYADDALDTDEENYAQQMARVADFLAADENSRVTALHKSPWKKSNEQGYADCISFFRKIRGMMSGKMIGVVEMEIPETELVSLYRRVMSDTIRIDLASEEAGGVIASPQQDLLYVPLADFSWYGRYAEAAAGQGEGLVTLEERDEWVFVKPYTAQGWLMISTVQKSATRAALRRYLTSLIFFSGLIILCALVLVRFLARSITRPLSKITRTVVAIGQGDSAQRADVRDGGEIGILAAEFNHMLDLNQSLMEEVVQKEEAKRETELSMLQLQMTPHFFYNILESLVGLIYMDEKRTAVQTIQHLSGFYRGVLNRGQEIIQVAQELETARNYLEIMKICHPGQFDYRIDCDEAAKACSICKLTLQPILENAIHHGFQEMHTGGRIDVRVTVTEDLLLVDVRDNGKGMDREERSRVLLEENGGFRMESFGLRNTDDRIKLYFGQAYGIRIPDTEEGTQITIRLPRQAYGTGTQAVQERADSDVSGKGGADVPRDYRG